MKLYKTTCATEDGSQKFSEFASSASDASKARTRLKKAGMYDINTEEVDVPTTRSELIVFLNKMNAHESWMPAAVGDALSK